MNLRLLASALLVVVASQSLPGCFFIWDRDEPVEPPLVLPPDEPASFRFTASRGCGPFGDGCSAERPLMAGVRESVLVRLPGSDPGGEPAVQSSDPSVIEVGALQRRSSSGSYLGVLEVRAGDHAGSATITVTAIDGQSSTVVLRVDDAAGMDLVEDEGTTLYDRAHDRISLRVGERISLNGYPVNRDGERLYANDGVVWTVPNTEHINLVWSWMTGERVADDHVYVEARAPGTEVITVRAGVVERTLLVDVR